VDKTEAMDPPERKRKVEKKEEEEEEQGIFLSVSVLTLLRLSVFNLHPSEEPQSTEDRI